MSCKEQYNECSINYSDDCIKFVSLHINESPADLILKYKTSNLTFDIEKAVTQIDCRRRTSDKLKSFNNNPKFYFPSRLAAEQASNEEVAKYHASLISPQCEVADLTTGLGIDAMSMASVAKSVETFNIENENTEALKHNVEVLGINNVIINPTCDSIEHLKKSEKRYDILFIDPARRDNNETRTYAFSDCSPNVVELLPLLLSRCNKLIIKASPMLDMTQTEREIKGIKELKAVSRKGECKEILAVVEKDYNGPCIWSAVMIQSNGEFSEYIPKEQFNNTESFPNSIDNYYLYEPDAAILKLGTKANLEGNFPELFKCDNNTNIYISRNKYDNFPGRVLKIRAIWNVNDKQLKQLKGSKYNVVCRNFPLSPMELKKRLRIKDGGRDFIYGITVKGKHKLIEVFKE